MKLRIKNTAFAIVWAALLAATAGANDAPALRNNPFARPPSVASAPILSDARSYGNASEIDLRATLVGSRDKLANVAGKTLRPGDEVQGYTLVQVFEDRAVFAREGNRLTIYVKPELEEDDEE